VQVINPFCFEEPTVTGDTFLTMRENTTLCYVPVGSLRLDGAPSHFFRRVPEMFKYLVRTEYHLDVCHTTNEAQIEIYRAHKKRCEVQCLKMYHFHQ
jgi:hypothetical protein